MPDNPDMPTQPVVGVAAIHVRDTEHQAPSQVLGTRLRWPNPNVITAVVDSGELQSTTGYYGGPLPDHSSTWSSYFQELWNIFPSGKDQQFVVPPDPVVFAGLMSEQQDAATINSDDAWTSLRNNFAKMWGKGAPPATYKKQHP